MQKEAPPPGFVPHPGFAPPSGSAPPPPYNDGHPSVVVIQTPAFGSDSQRMTCPNCGTNISTRTDNGPNLKTHMFALLLCVIGLWCCAPCPYCMDSCLVTKHYCPSCNAYLGQSDN